ncbi:hypothetical protein ES703_58760 [subsurface metagenome]
MRGSSDLHPPGMPDGRVWNIPITRNFVGGVYNNNPLIKVVSQHPGYLAQHRRLTHTGTTQQQDTLSRLDKVFNNFDSTEDCPAHPAGKPHDTAPPIANSRDTVESTLNAGTVIIAKATDARDDIVNVLLVDFLWVKHDFPVRKASLRQTAKVKDNFQQVLNIRLLT